MIRHTERNTVRCTPLQQAIIEAGAARQFQSTPEFMAQAATEKARQMLSPARLAEIESRFSDGGTGTAATD